MTSCKIRNRAIALSRRQFAVAVPHRSAPPPPPPIITQNVASSSNSKPSNIPNKNVITKASRFQELLDEMNFAAENGDTNRVLALFHSSKGDWPMPKGSDAQGKTVRYNLVLKAYATASA